jgi:hypothetical protein
VSKLRATMLKKEAIFVFIKDSIANI